LKVELSDDLKELVKIVSGGQTAQGGAA